MRIRRTFLRLSGLLPALAFCCDAPASPPGPQLLSTSTVFQYPQDDPYDRSNLYGFNHAPSVTRMSDGRLLAAWFSGPFEASVHQLILGSYSADDGATWSAAEVLHDAPRRSDFDPAFVSDGEQTWMFFTVGRWDRYPFVGLRDVEREEVGVASYKLFARTTPDAGGTWTDARQILDDVSWGCRSNGIRLAGGELLIPVYHFGTQAAGVVRSDDGGRTWTRYGNIQPPGEIGANEPTVTELPSGELLMAVRSRDGFLWESRSEDRGTTWSAPRKTEMIAAASSHNLFTTSRGHVVLTHNPCPPSQRTPLTMRLSDDDGRTWGTPLELARIQHPQPGEDVFGRSVCYPSVAELADGSLVVVWTQIEMSATRHSGIIHAARVQCESAAVASADESIEWAGEGRCRLLVEVSPVEIGSRERDEMPAEVDIDLAALLPNDRRDLRVDATTFQVMRLEGQSGEPQAYDDYACGRSRFDRPFRWHDAAIPYDFPEVFRPSSYSGGERIRQVSPRAGYMYDAIGDWRQGRLAFAHTQRQHEAARYAIYFDLLPAGEEPQQAPPQGWLGDGLPRRDIVGDSTTGCDDTKITLDDFDDDGLIDIVYGEQYGQLFVMPNRGTRTAPRFPFCKMLFEADGQPLDLGIHATPLIVDWDQDGVKDILAGTYQNSIAFFKNVGTNRQRQFVYQGFIKEADGATLELPFRPVAEKPEGVFTHDYYPILSAVDWNQDGRIDLLAGGYVTGRIYYYENVAQRPGEPPVLQLQGPLHADGEPLNVRDWGAAPCVADFNGDGLLDLVSGSYTWLPHKKEQPSFLRYYENIGTPGAPVLTERPFPFRGDFRSFRLPVPRAADWNGDGLVDLIVSSGAEILLFRNAGTATAPEFEIHHDAIPCAWGNARLPGSQIIDYNFDGFPDLVSGYSVHLNSGAGNPYRFDKTVNVLPAGVHIDHPVEVGDGHFWPYLADLDGDGKLDVLFGDWHGQVWFHRNLSESGETKFDVDGVKLSTEGGQPIKVGPQDGDPEQDFVALQGARTVFTLADYNGDGLHDLVVGDTYGKIRYFRSLGPAGLPAFASPVLIGDMKFRLLVDAVDWNDDGRMDVLAGTDSHQISVFLNLGESDAEPFSAAIPLSIPQIKETRVRAVDLNRDGDQDLFVLSTQGSILVERSFLNHGYAQGKILKLEQKPTQ